MEKQLEEIEVFLKQLEDMAPTEIDEKYNEMENLMPFHVLILRDGLIHRVLDLSRSALEMYKNKNMIPGIVLTRSVFESVALIYFLSEKVDKYLSDRNIKNLDNFLERSTLGSKNDDTEYESINVLTAIDKLNRKYTGLRKLYNSLSEHAHPNWAGTFGSYIRLNENKNKLILGPNSGTLAHIGLPPLIIALAVFIFYYGKLKKDTNQLVEACQE